MTELHEEKKTMTFFLRFFLRKVKSSMKRWLAAAKREILIGGARRGGRPRPPRALERRGLGSGVCRRGWRPRRCQAGAWGAVVKLGKGPSDALR